MNPLLSIIIPTKNRYEYIEEIIKILVRIKYSEVEFVIQDNSSDTALQESFIKFVQELKDERIKYFYCKEDLSINENSNRAVLNSKGKYVCFIGDDDCVTPEIVNATKWMEGSSVDVISFECPTYIWTDVEYKRLRSKRMGLLSYSEPRGRITGKDPSKELLKLLRIGGQSLKNMPQLYHGIVSRAVLDQIHNKTGSYFPGSVPDMDVAVCLALYSKKHYKLDAPIVISGTAKRSAGGLGAADKHKGEIRKIPTLPKDTADFWNPDNPFFWSAPTIYADSIYKCLIRTGNEELLQKFNYNYLYATLLTFNIDYFHEILRTVRSNKNCSYLKILYYLIVLLSFRSYIFVKNRIPVFKGNQKTFYFQTLQEAELHMEKVTDIIKLPWRT